MAVRVARQRILMWSGIAGSVSLLVVLLALGWGRRAWTVASVALFVSCIAVCGLAIVQGRIAERDVRKAVARLDAERRGHQGSSTSVRQDGERAL